MINVVEEFRKNWPEPIEFELTEAEVQLEAKSLELDSTLARVTLGWTPTMTQLEAVAATATWWRKVLIERSSVIETCISDIRDALFRSKVLEGSILNTKMLRNQE